MSNTSNANKGKTVGVPETTQAAKLKLSGAEAIIAHYASCDLSNIQHSDNLDEIGVIALKFVKTCPQSLRLSSSFVDTIADLFATIAYRCDESDWDNEGLSDFDLLALVEIATQKAISLIATTDYMTRKEIR